MGCIPPLHRLGHELYKNSHTYFFGPIINASGTEEIAAACALLGLTNNVCAYRAVKHITCEVGKSIFIESEEGDFVEF